MYLMSYNCFAEEVAKGPKRHVAAQVSTILKTAISISADCALLDGVWLHRSRG
jgi:hypothetical protein